jgi:hypothetical protein
LHFSGVTNEPIREGNKKYHETKNGIIINNHHRQFQVNVDPFVEPGDSDSGLLPLVQKGELGEKGAPSKYIMGYCFRLCLTKRNNNRIAIPKPNGYNPWDFEIYRRYLKSGGKLFQPHVNRPNGKTDLGSWHDLSANFYGKNWRYPSGDYETQNKVIKHYRYLTQGLIWFLQNDPAVDKQTRENWESWGLCKDEFTDNEGWPRRLYIRSARRMVSPYVITEHHTKRKNVQI